MCMRTRLCECSAVVTKAPHAAPRGVRRARGSRRGLDLVDGAEFDLGHDFFGLPGLRLRTDYSPSMESMVSGCDAVWCARLLPTPQVVISVIYSRKFPPWI
jgi:hypothetical protein